MTFRFTKLKPGKSTNLEAVADFSELSSDGSMVIPLSGLVSNHTNLKQQNHDKQQSLVDIDQDILQIVNNLGKQKEMSSTKKDKKSKRESTSVALESESDLTLTTDESHSSSKKKKKKHKKSSEMGYFSSNSDHISGTDGGLSTSESRKRKRLSSVTMDTGLVEDSGENAFADNLSSTKKKKKKHKRSHTSENDSMLDPEPSTSARSRHKKTLSTSKSKKSSMRSSCPDKYIQLPGYHQTKVWCEDFEDDDIELYLCQMPEKMDVSVLDKQVIKENGHLTITVQSQSSLQKKSVEVEMMKSTHHERSASLAVIARAQLDKELHVVNKPLVGRIVMTEGVVSRPYRLPEVQPRPSKELPPGLKQRHVPFGHVGAGQPFSDTEEKAAKKKKKKKKKHRHKEESDL